MKKIIVGCAIIGMSIGFGGCSMFKKDVNVAVISATSISDSLPFQLLEGKSWKADPRSRYVRLDFLLDRGIKLGRIEIDTENELKEGIIVFLNALEATYYVYPKGKSNTVDVPYDSDVSVININFGQNNGVAVKAIRFFDKDKKQIALKSAKVIEGTVTASTTLDPVRSYNVNGLFDSRVEFGWSSRGKKSGDTIEFIFAKPQKITSLRLWNGYQRSRIHFDANSRVKTLKIEGGKGYSQTVSVKDDMGSQDIKLDKAFEGRVLKMTIVDNYDGKDYSDLVISELRFFDGDSFVLVNPVKFIKSNIDYNRKMFREANVESVLDAQAVYQGENPADALVFRFRADGSVYAEGTVPVEEKRHKYFLLGNYEVVNKSPEGISIKIFGYIVTQEGEYTIGGPVAAAEEEAPNVVDYGGGDCGGGGPEGEYEYKDATKKIFTEHVLLRSNPNGGVTIVNTGEKHNISFDQADFSIN